MWTRTAGLLGLLLLLLLPLLLSGCCTTDECANERSGIDRNRVNSPRAKLEVVYNDSVSWARRDRTDWREVMLTQKGTLTVELHWDNGKATLELDVFDVMGVKIQEGRVFGTGGLRALVAVEEPNPYYVRIRAAGTHDESQYSVRIHFEPHPGGACVPCKVSDRKCLDNNAVIVCELTAPGCTNWKTIIQCDPGVTCRAGICDPCITPCPENSRQCHSATEFKICTLTPGAPCAKLGPPQKCPPRHQCRDGQCVRSGGNHKPKCPASCPQGLVCNRASGVCERQAAPPPSTSSECRIISVYQYRGTWTLHLDCGAGHTVRPGCTGSVLEGSSNKPLPGGEVRVTRVTGNYAIATTSLQQLGLNRRVRITRCP